MSDLQDHAEQWPTRGSEDVWSAPGPFSVRRDLVAAPDRPDETFARLVVQHPGAVIVLALDDDERALVLEQYRHPVGMRLVELPAGLLDAPAEDPLVAAKRELLEEAAHTAAQWRHLLTVYPSPGLSSEHQVFFVARTLTHAPDRGGFRLKHEEADMTLRWVPLVELEDGVRAGRLTDGPLVLAILAYRAGYAVSRT